MTLPFSVEARDILTKRIRVTGSQNAICFSKEESNVLGLRRGQVVVIGIIEVRDK